MKPLLIAACVAVPFTAIGQETMQHRLSESEQANKRGHELVHRGDVRGIELLEQAAGDGIVAAMVTLHLCYYVGKGGLPRPDPTRGLYWLEQAAIHGDLDSRQDFAEQLLRGSDVRQDLFRAHGLLTAVVFACLRDETKGYESITGSRQPQTYYEVAAITLAQLSIEVATFHNERGKWIQLLTELAENGGTLAAAALETYSTDAAFRRTLLSKPNG